MPIEDDGDVGFLWDEYHKDQIANHAVIEDSDDDDDWDDWDEHPNTIYVQD